MTYRNGIDALSSAGKRPMHSRAGRNRYVAFSRVKTKQDAPDLYVLSPEEAEYLRSETKFGTRKELVPLKPRGLFPASQEAVVVGPDRVIVPPDVPVAVVREPGIGFRARKVSVYRGEPTFIPRKMHSYPGFSPEDIRPMGPMEIPAYISPEPSALDGTGQIPGSVQKFAEKIFSKEAVAEAQKIIPEIIKVPRRRKAPGVPALSPAQPISPGPSPEEGQDTRVIILIALGGILVLGIAAILILRR